MDTVWIWLGGLSLILLLVLIYLRALGVISVRSVTWKVSNSLAMKTKEVYICVLILLIIGVAYYCHNYFIQQPTRKKIYTSDRSQIEFDRLKMNRNRGQNKIQNGIQQNYRQEILTENAKYSSFRDKNLYNGQNQGDGPQVAKPSYVDNNVKGKVDTADVVEERDDYDDMKGPDEDVQGNPAEVERNFFDSLKDKAKEIADRIIANKAKIWGSDTFFENANETNGMGQKMDQPAAADTKGTSQKTCPKLQPMQKFDCHSEIGATEQLCTQRECCWEKDPARQKAMVPKDGKSKQAPVDVPYCYYPLDYPGYSITDSMETAVGFNYRLLKNTLSYYPGDVKLLLMEVIFQTENILRVRITDANKQRYEVPLDVPKARTKASNRLYDVSVPSTGSPFSLSVMRRSTRTTVFSTKHMAPLIFTDQFLQLSSSLPSHYIFGIGERRGDLMMSTNWTRHTIWTRDQGPREETNLYGAHPFYQVMESDGNSNGFFLMNSNAMDVVVQPLPAITWKTIGGILDFYIFMGPTPQDVTRQLTSIVGRPFMPPYWSLGFHICRWGYKNVKETLEVVEGMRKAGIPQDVQWNDIDYMNNKEDFTTDEKNFGNQAELVQAVHNYGMKYIVIVDPGIPVNVTKGKYKPLDLGLALDIFLKNDSGHNLIGKVWPGHTVFPDFTHPKSQLYWTTLVSEFIDKVPVDGLWIDMNEIANFVNGSVQGCPNTKYDNPPYTPDVSGGSLYVKTICPSGKSYISRVYDDHNLYGLKESNATYQALMIKKKLRPFVISRSTYTGQGHFGGHWSGDNHVTFHDLYRSVSEILSMNMFGIPMVGADICGFSGNTTYELCLRWHQLGAFYPFSRNHNDHKDMPQEPFRFDEAFAKAVREVYLLRYSLLPYLYTLFYESHTQGHTVARAMFQEFPFDRNTYRIETQFLWGSSLMIVPVVEKNATTVKAYLPFRSMWYDFFMGQPYSGGQVITLKAPMDKINLLVHGGNIIPMQIPAQTTYESRKKDFILLGAYNSKQTGHGVLYWDDGDSLDTYAQKAYNEIKFYMNTTTLFSKVISAGYQTRMVLETITLYGVRGKPTSITINGQLQQFTYNSQLQVLNISTVNPKVNLLQEFVLQLVGIPLALPGTVMKAPTQGYQQYPQQGQLGRQGQLGQQAGQQGQPGQQPGQPGQPGQQVQQGQPGQEQQGQQGQPSQQMQQGQGQPGQQGQEQQGQQVLQGQQIKQGQPFQQGQMSNQDNKVYNFVQKNQGNSLTTLPNQPRSGMSVLVNKDRLTNQIPSVSTSTSKLSEQPALREKNMMTDPSRTGKVGEPLNRDPSQTQYNSIDKVQVSNQNDYNNRVRGSRPDDVPSSNQNTFGNRIPPSRFYNAMNRKVYSNQNGVINRLQNGIGNKPQLPDGFRQNLPVQNQDRLSRSFPVQNQLGSRQNLPVQNQGGLKQNEPLQHEEFRNKLLAINQERFQKNLPLMNPDGTVRNSPVQNQDNLRQNLPVKNQDILRQNSPVQNQDEVRQNSPVQNQDELKQNVPLQSQEGLKNRLKAIKEERS